MTIRCTKCHGTVWFQPDRLDHKTTSVTCKKCGQDYVLKGWRKLRDSKPSISERARRLAKERGLDMPAAYSFLLGIATVEDLRELGDSGSTLCRTAPDPEPEAGSHRYDRAFQPAIDAGFLTPRQARGRGNRAALAAMMASRHRIPEELAFDVVDNRISLLEAIRKRPEEQEVAKVMTVPGRLLAPIGLLVVFALAAVLFHVTRDRGVQFAAGSGTQRTMGEVELRTDAGGRITQVSGPDPRSVLDAYCKAGPPGTRLEPLEVVPSSLPGGGRARLGLLRNPRRPDDVLSITIVEDRETGRWNAGEGVEPVIAELAPVGAERAIRTRRP